MAWTNLIILIALFLWLGFETIWDLRDRKIPIWFSLATVLPGLVWLGCFVSPWVAVLMAISIISTEIYRRSIVFGFIGIFAPLPPIILLFPTLLPLVIGWWVLVSLWFLNVLGGADALAALALLLFFPSWGMAACIVAGFLAWGLAVLWVRHRKNLGLRLWTVFSNRLDGERLPAIGALASASLIYFLARLFYA